MILRSSTGLVSSDLSPIIAHRPRASGEMAIDDVEKNADLSSTITTDGRPQEDVASVSEDHTAEQSEQRYRASRASTDPSATASKISTEPFPPLPSDPAPKGQSLEIVQREPVVVPRLRRRGLLGQFALLAEVDNAQLYPRRTKWFITFIVAVAGATAPMASSIFFRKGASSFLCA